MLWLVFFFLSFPTMIDNCFYRHSDWVFDALLTWLEPHQRSFLEDQSLFTSSPPTAHMWRWWNDFWIDGGYEGHYRRWCIGILYTWGLFLNEHTITIAIITGQSSTTVGQQQKRTDNWFSLWMRMRTNQKPPFDNAHILSASLRSITSPILKHIPIRLVSVMCENARVPVITLSWKCWRTASGSR